MASDRSSRRTGIPRWCAPALAVLVAVLIVRLGRASALRRRAAAAPLGGGHLIEADVLLPMFVGKTDFLSCPNDGPR